MGTITVIYQRSDNSTIPWATDTISYPDGALTVSFTVRSGSPYPIVDWILTSNSKHYRAGETVTLTPLQTVYYLMPYRYEVILNYDLNGGAGDFRSEVAYHTGPLPANIPVSVTSDLPSRQDWAFRYWVLPNNVPVNPGETLEIRAVSPSTQWNLRAYWYQNTSGVKYALEDGSIYSTESRKHGVTSGTVPFTIISSAPSEQYKTFSHWMVRNGTQTYEAGDTVDVPFNGEVELVAVFTPNRVRVKYHDGTTVMGDGGDAGDTLSIMNLSKDDYVLKGWALSEGGDVVYTPGQVITLQEDLELWAVWNPAFAEAKVTLADGTEVSLADILWNVSDIRTQEIGVGTADTYLDDLGYADVQFVPKDLVERFPSAFGFAASEMESARNPSLTYSNVLHDGVLTVKFDALAGGYIGDSLKLAVFNVTTMRGYILVCYLSQETDTTEYTIILRNGESDPSPSVFTGLLGSYRNPYLFTFPLLTDEGHILDKWVSNDTGKEYSAGETLSLIGRYITPKQTLIFTSKMRPVPTELRFALQGGREGPSTLVEEGATEFRIPRTVPVKTGSRFLGWAVEPSGSPTIHPDTVVTVLEGQVNTFYAVWEKITSPFTAQGDLYLPYCGIRIWKDENAYFNATFYQVEGGMAVINKAENRPGSATFTLANDTEDMTRCLCSPSFSQWSDGTAGAIEPGMYVELLDVKTVDEADPVMDGRITTITPKGETVAFEVGDGITFLSKTGSWLRRNYREENSTKEVYKDGVPDREGRTLTFDLGRLPITSAFRMRSTEESVAVSRRDVQTYDGMVPSPVQDPYSNIRKVSFRVVWSSGTGYGYHKEAMKPSIQIGDTSIKSQPIDITTNSGSVTVTIDGSELWGYDLLGSVPLTINIGLKTSLVATFNVSVRDCTMVMDRKEQLSSLPPTYYVDTDVSDLDLDDPTNRLYLVVEGGALSVKTIMEQIAEGIGYAHDIPSTVPAKHLATFRAGGAYADTYIRKLADLSDAGHSFSYTVEGQDPVLRVGTRYSVTDAPEANLVYGGDYDPAPQEGVPFNIPMSDFTPKRTMKNRPNLVTMRAVLSEGNQAVTLTFENPQSTVRRRKALVENITTDSSVSSMQEAGFAAFADLNSSELDQWEGEATLPGIVLGFMSDDAVRKAGHAGSGIPVIVTDHRYGIIGERTKVRQVTYDYNQCITKVTLGNYDLQYSSAISNTNALVVDTSDLVGGVADVTLYNQQYVYVRKKSSWKSSRAQDTMFVNVQDGRRFQLENVNSYELPGNSWVLAGTIKADATHCVPFSVAYGVVSVTIEQPSEKITVDIPLFRRPDLYYGQTLTVCVLISPLDIE